MFRVLQHYLPIRTALLFFGETVILTAVVGVGMSQHLWELLGGVRGDNYRELRLALGRLELGAEGAFWMCLLSSFLVGLVCQVAIGFNQLYEFHISSSRFERAARFVESAGAGIAMSLVLVSLIHVSDLAPKLGFPGLTYTQKLQALVGSLVVAFTLLYFWRMAFHGLMRRVNLNLRVLVLGSRGPAHELTNVILATPEVGYEVAGLVPEAEVSSLAEAEGREPPPEASPRAPKLVAPAHAQTDASRALVLEDVELVKGAVANVDVAMSSQGGGALGEQADSLLTLARRLQVDMLVVALEDRRRTLPTLDLLRCRLDGLDVREREEIFEQITGKIAVAAMRPSYLIFNEGFRRHPWTDLMKRTVDVICSLLLLLLLWPIMLLTAVAVRFESRGPVLFRQTRVGRDGRVFTLMKFRSMRMDAEQQTGPVWTAEDDPRVTRVGRFIRKTRLDELPQLFNVLAGSMSLVGPRPERRHFVDDLSEQIPYYHLRHIVKPGITGWAQINYPYGSSVEDALHKLQFDLFYVKNHSVLFDLSVLFSTIKTVVLQQGT